MTILSTLTKAAAAFAFAAAVTFAAPEPAKADGGDFAAGVVGGALLGAVIAGSNKRSYGYSSNARRDYHYSHPGYRRQYYTGRSHISRRDRRNYRRNDFYRSRRGFDGRGHYYDR